MIILFLHYTPITGLVPHFFIGYLIQFSTQCSYFHYGKVKGTFSYPHIFREIRLDHLVIFSLMELGLKVELKICVYRWSIDLVIVCFSHLFHLGLLMGILQSHLQASHSGHLYDSGVLVIHPDFGLPPQDHELACCIVIFQSFISCPSSILFTLQGVSLGVG